MKFLFWLSLGLVFYAFLGYGILLFVLVKLRRLLKPARRAVHPPDDQLPTMSLIIAAYNEENTIERKIENTLALRYPADRLRIIFVTDGSSDLTPGIVASYPELGLMHSPERKGKIHAIHRVMETVSSEIVVFTDANTFLNQSALVLIARHYADPGVGAVSGEKRVSMEASADATSGEGFYWKYESRLKKWDSELYSVVGAAGELFSVRRSLYMPVPADTILDDFMISMLVAAQGYRIVYEPEAYAVEEASENITEELKRKVRIAAGGIQSVLRLLPLLNPLRFPILSFQYVSHRVLRWTVTPPALILAFMLNIWICLDSPELVYRLLLAGQCLFYLMALLGWWAERKSVKVRAFFIPYYFCMMNYAVLAGIFRFVSGKQSAVWEKAKRKGATAGALLSVLSFAGIFAACNGTTESKTKAPEEVRVVVNDTIPPERDKVSAAPVAAYSVKVPDELNEFQFAVKLYETPLRFRYKATVRYKMMDVKDSVDIPNFGYQPRVDVKKAEGDLACMIGFYDEEGNFRDLKKVEVINNQLRIRQVKRYGIGTVKKK